MLCAVDETLYPYHGHIGYKQSNASKPAKCGLLYHSLGDSSTQYTSFTLLDGAKPEDLSGEKSKLYIPGTNDYTNYFVPGFSKYNSIK